MKKTTLDYINLILLKYIEEKHKALKSTVPALVIFDHFQGQCTKPVLNLLEQNNILIAVVLPNCTDRLQPLDVSVNKAVKEFLRGKFQSLYSNQICKRVSEDGADKLVDVRMSVVKSLGARWLIELYEHMKSKPEIIVMVFMGLA